MATNFAIHHIKAKIKFNTVYKCASCSNKAIGRTMFVEFDGSSTTELKDMVDSIHQSANYMPVGWSFNGKFNCGCGR